MNIRKITKAEIQKVATFYDNTVKWLDENINYPRWIYKVYPSFESVEEMTSLEAQYICEENGEIVAAFGLNNKPQGTFYKGNWEQELNEGEFLVIHALAIKPEKQKHGLGTTIVKFCIKHTQENGFKAIRLDIVPSNYPAKALFEKNGFRHVGDYDLEMRIKGIPEFSLYELNW